MEDFFKKWHLLVLLYTEKVPPDSLLSHALKLVNLSLSHMTQGLCKLLPLQLGLRVNEYVHEPFKSTVSVSHSPLALLDINLAGFKATQYGDLTSQCSPLGWGV